MPVTPVPSAGEPSRSRSGPSGRSSPCREELTDAGIVNQNVLPVPTLLINPQSPPMSNTSCAQMARPKPVPPYSRAVELSP
jgi:hypothetical protein